MKMSPSKSFSIIIAALFLSLTPMQQTLADPGDLDTTFGTDGKVTTDIDGTSNDAIFSTAIQSDGKIVAAGSASVGGDRDFAVARYNSDGSLDTSFASAGINSFAIVTGGDEEFHQVLVLSDGSLILAGFGDQDPSGADDWDFMVVKLTSTGTFDTTFGTNGVVTTSFGRVDDRLLRAAVQSDGKIVCSGYSANDAGTAVEFALARYNSDGSLDTSFGTDGKVTTSFLDPALAYGLALQSDGKIVLSGLSFGGATPRMALARYNTDGSLDTTFGTDGKVEMATGLAGAAQLIDVKILNDGKIVAGGTYADTSNDFFVARFSSDGSLDTSFGPSSNGMVNTDFLGNSNDMGNSLLIQDDGKIVLVGSAASDFAVARYNPDGSLDNNATFSTDGMQTIDFSGNDDVAYAVSIQSNGKLVIGGEADVGGGVNDFALARLDSESADLAIAIASSESSLATGNNFDYTVTVTNHGPDTAGGIHVTGTVPPELSYVSAAVDSGTVTCTGTTELDCLLEDAIANGGSVAVTITVTADAAGDPVTLTLNVSAQVQDPDSTNNSASVDVTITEAITPATSGGGCSLMRR